MLRVFADYSKRKYLFLIMFWWIVIWKGKEEACGTLRDKKNRITNSKRIRRNLL